MPGRQIIMNKAHVVDQSDYSIHKWDIIIIYNTGIKLMFLISIYMYVIMTEQYKILTDQKVIDWLRLYKHWVINSDLLLMPVFGTTADVYKEWYYSTFCH